MGASLLLPYCLPEAAALERFVISLGLGVGVLHLVDLHLDKRQHSALLRVFFMNVPVELRELQAIRPQIKPRLLFSTLSWGLVAIGTLYLYLIITPTISELGYLLRWTLGVVFFYALVEWLCSFLNLMFAALGYRIPPLHRSPLLACTVQEFWGERWNLFVGGWFRRYIYQPFARMRRPKTGLLASFVGSAILHIWLMVNALSWKMAGVWAIFFLIQGPVILLERRLRIHHRPILLQRGWTLLLLFGLSPLFTEPMMRLLPLNLLAGLLGA